MKALPPLCAVDLFSGCGGISAGLRAAGFTILAGVDINKPALATFADQFPGAKVFNKDLSGTAPEAFMELLNIAPGELDLLAGGPPCQGFSKNVPRSQRYLDDPKNMLVRTFLDYVEAIKPKMVLMENVAEMKNSFGRSYTDEINGRLAEAGYEVNYEVLLSAEYGVPQMRRRAFFVGIKGGPRPMMPTPTHFPLIAQSEAEPSLFKGAGTPFVSVWEAIGDLPSLKCGEGEDPRAYPHPVEVLSEYQKLIRGDSERITNHVARKLSSIQYERLSVLAPGEGIKDLPSRIRPKGGYSGAYGRLTMDMVAPTLTRWLFHPGSGRFGHPKDVRTITIREAARIQSFPDTFSFKGSYNQQSEQIGNAVPPLLAQKIAESLLKSVQTRQPVGVK